MAKALVAFFSASGVTAKLAANLANAIGADLYEIMPEVPYTEADLDWRDKKSRSTIEMEDRSSRPAIGNRVEDISQYDTVFVGFPVWWYREPSIIDTFIEAYDFSGKAVVPFATSGGSGLGDTYKNLQALAPSAIVKDGRKFSPDASAKSLKEWAEKFL